MKLGAVQWRAESELSETGQAAPRLSAVTLKAELLEQVPQVRTALADSRPSLRLAARLMVVHTQAQLDALKQRALQDSPLTALLTRSGCTVDMQLTPPAWMFSSSMGEWRELLQRAA